MFITSSLLSGALPLITTIVTDTECRVTDHSLLDDYTGSDCNHGNHHHTHDPKFIRGSNS